MNDLYVTFASSDIYDENYGVIHTHAANGYNTDRTFVNWDSSTNTSIRSDYQRYDYEYFRSTKTPKSAKDFMMAGEKAYNEVGIIHNIIDLMSDFGCQGLQIEHPVPRYERLFNRWYNRVQGKDRSERFLNLLYRKANVPIYRSFGKVNVKAQKKLMSTYGSIEDDGAKVDNLEYKKGIIPLNYTFLDPMSLEIYASEVSLFGGKRAYYFHVPSQLRKEIQEVRKERPELLSEIPNEILEKIDRGDNKIFIDPDRLSVYHYKKDDWQDWAKPMTSAILKDVALLDQMKLADTAALDGAISNIRLWTVGWKGEGPADSFLPTKAMLEKIRNILAQNVGGGVMDLVWGPELSFLESKSEVYKFLGSEKYVATLDAIYDGMGIPPTLRSGGGSTNTNNFMSLKTLVERLNYGRDKLIDFWTKELTTVQRALGIAVAPTITFSSMSLSDEAGEKKLLIDLADRNIISESTLLQKFNISSDIEPLKVKREHNDRGTYLPEKAGPFHVAEKEHEMKKIALTSGGNTPSEVGLELKPRKAGEVPLIDKQLKARAKQQASKPGTKSGSKPIAKKKKPKGVGAGRPKNVTETRKRKVKPRNIKTLDSRADAQDFASKFLWACDVQNTIASIVVPNTLEKYSKPNVRSLTKQQSSELETSKYQILFDLGCFETVNAEIVYNKLNDLKDIDSETQAMVKGLVDNFHSINNREPTIDEQRQIYATVYALIH